MSKRKIPYGLAAAYAATVGVFLLLGSFGHLEATLSLVDGISLPTILILLPSILLLGVGLFNLLASWGLWKGNGLVYSLAVGLNGILLAYLAFLLARGVPGHPLWFFTLMIGAYFIVLMSVRQLANRPAEPVAS